MILVATVAIAVSCTPQPEYDLILRNGTIFDGTGAPGVVGDVAIQGDRVAAVGDIGSAKAPTEIDVSGLAVSPGFINMLSWSTESLIADGRSQGEIRQGVTLEVMGEGWSMGPVNDAMKQLAIEQQTDFKFDIEWTTLGEYLDYLVARGVSPNVASFVGATGVRIHEIGEEDRAPTSEELERMKALVRQAMEEGAMGLSTALVYAPAFYAKTDEIIELAKVASEYNGLYISHLRSEGSQLLEALDEFLTIAREAEIDAEIYHLKAGGKSNWSKMDQVIEKVEAARAEGLNITADMYTYTAGSTALAASLPPWVHDGGFKKLLERIQDPATRDKIAKEMSTPTDEWENFYYNSTAEGILLVGFKTEELKSLTGKTLAEVAEMRGTPPEITAMDLIIEDDSGIGAVYFMMSEENVKKQIALPWVAFDSDAASMATEGVFLKSSTHPRAYGCFARLLGKYVRDEKVIPLEEAIRRLTSFPADNLKIKERGRLEPGYFADVVVFDPATIQDHATFENPHQYATGVVHVFVNGTQVLKDGEHTGATPGRVVRGPGWTGDQ
jgi:N-acyl-D-amino-acid deacylase